MAYLGGKSKAAEHILYVLNHPVFNAYDYIEPFCGYCHILRRVEHKKSYMISDNNKYLIALLKHVQKTKNKHPTITKSEYDELKSNPDSDPLRAAYAAFCYSYNGKYFGGYTTTYKNRNYPKERKRYYDQLHDNPVFHEASISNRDYTHYANVKNKLIYCDPPYEGTTEYHSEFNSSKFWDTIRKLSKHNYVFVSEYNAPDDFTCITQHVKRNSIAGRGATRKRIEKVFVHTSLMSDNKIKEILKEKKFKCVNTTNKTRKQHTKT
jgi:DNA adenine methylase